jgi:hypothetical protein
MLNYVDSVQSISLLSVQLAAGKIRWGQGVRLKCGSGCGTDAERNGCETERMGLKCGTDGVKMRNGTDGVKMRNGTEWIWGLLKCGTGMGLKC